VRYRFDVPESLSASALPLQVKAKLRHRSRNLALKRATCADAATPRGAALVAEAKRRNSVPLDACAAEPVVDMSESEVWIGEGWQGRAHADAMPVWRRMFDHALGTLHALQENLDDARPSLERALADLSELGADRERAMVMVLYAQLAARQARTDEALLWADRADALLPKHPATAHARGEALSTVWRWKDAEEPLREAANASPLDPILWSHLSVALGSAGDAAEALDASRRGLLLQPRDPDMLHVQALALEKLGADADTIARARESFLSFRTPDDAPRVKNACSMTVQGCALERVPVHVHAMRPIIPR
jgi:tetratricopeptide (TPR) repeat protein